MAATRWEGDVVLADGGTMHVRPIRPEDGPLIEAFHARQSAASIYFRYFSPRPRLTERDLERLTNVDYVDRMAFVGLIGEELVGVARYDRLPTSSAAEVAFFTDDAHTGRGMATVLLEYLAAAAREVGISGFAATVLPDNHKMLSVFKQAGFEVSSRFSEGVIEVELGIEPTPDALAKIEERARMAYARSVARILAPNSVAIIGASREPGTIGHELVRRIVAGNFCGPVYPVNPSAPYVASVRAYPSVLDVPDEVDVAVIAVAAEHVVGVVTECALKRVQGLVVISAGFGEVGPEGMGREREIVELAHRHGMRLIGPNSMGVINTSPDVSLSATFLGAPARPGPIGFLSQSGTLGAAVLSHARRLGLGFSTFVAVGNRPDVSGNDLLQYWEDDPATDVVLLYLEDFGNPRNFARIARRISRRKPVVAVKSGRSITPEPADAEGWPAEATIDAMLRQTGVLRVDTLEQLFDVARLVVHQPVPAGPRVAVVSNSWGPAVLATDACAGAGLALAELSPEGVEALRDRLPPHTLPPADRPAIPLNLGHAAGADEYRTALEIVLEDPGVDTALVLYAPPVPSETGDVGAAIARTAAASGVPVVATFLGAGGVALQDGDRSVPVFEFPEAAALALGRVAAYGGWRSRPPGTLPEADEDAEAAVSAIVESVLADAPAGRWLSLEETTRLLAAAGLCPVPQRLAGSADEVVAAATEIGYPVALKATGLERLAKTERGGLAVDLHSGDELRAAYTRMVDQLGDAMVPALVQAMAPAGVDCRVEVHQHPQLGAVIAFGLGGVSVEALNAAVQVLPITDADAERLVDAADVGPLVRRQGDAAVEAVQELLLRVSLLAEADPELAVVRLNPVIVSDAGALITDVALKVAPWTSPRGDWPVRRLD